MTQRILVTGGAGVIGRELLDLLSAEGSTVLSIDRLPLPMATPPGVEHLQADLAVDDLTPIVLFGPQVVLHLAATFERSAESPEFWAQNWSDNVVVTHRLVDLAATIPSMEAFAFASSYLVYRTSQYLFPAPVSDGVALAEDGPILPRNLCGAAKLYGEAELAFARETMHVPFRTVSARIFRVYGRGSRDIVSRWVRAALAGEAVDQYHPENRFDYVYSRDVADGLLRLVRDPSNASLVNLATGRARSIDEVRTAIEQATGHRLEVRDVDADEPWEGSRADTTRLRQLLDWVPPTDLADGVLRVVEHERSSRATAGAARA